jgi:hypothetical protein
MMLSGAFGSFVLKKRTEASAAIERITENIHVPQLIIFNNVYSLLYIYHAYPDLLRTL